MISRLGGDEFAIILPDTDANGARAVADSLLQQFQAPFVIDGQPVIVGASIGIAVSPDHGDEADTLLRRADVAMYVAKRSTSGWSMYRAEQDRNSPDRLLLISELRRAIDRDQLVLHYQPTINLQNGELVAVEALVRWQHPQRGLLSPDEFVPIAEQAALIEPLSQWVLRTALVQTSAWRRAGFDIPVAVNLSMRSLQDEQLPEKIAEVLESVDLPSSLLLLEITESTLMQDPTRTLAILEKLRGMGIRIAIDDFGTGHSSLAYLKRLTVDEVKIDRAFVRDIATDATDRMIVRSTIELAHCLGLCVVGEGIEDQITAALLAELGCDQAQGFYLSPPLHGDQIIPWARGREANVFLPRLAA
jgi:predicted signal transduction protein with EAL and GGDEF domain